MMVIFKKPSHAKLVTLELELNTFIDILKYRISKDKDKCVGKIQCFFNIIWRKKLSKNVY